MITWMQRHKKWLIITIWISTIAFVGAGFVGWGQYSYGDKAGAVAKVGDVEITQGELQKTYSRLYTKYNQMLQGNFDEEKAKQFGLQNQALQQLTQKALIINLAKEYDLQISDKELITNLKNQDAFYKDGVFDKELYKQVLSQNRMSAKEYEKELKTNLLVQKLLSLFPMQVTKNETNILNTIANIADKINYKVLSMDMIHIKIQEDKLQEFWKTQTSNFMNDASYEIEYITQTPQTLTYDKSKRASYYSANKSHFKDKDGKILSLTQAQSKIEKELNKKATKDKALRTYIAYKKNKLDSSIKKEIKTISKGNNPLGSETLQKISTTMLTAPYLKPILINGIYHTIKLLKINPATTKTFQEARREVLPLYTAHMKKLQLQTLAEKSLPIFKGKTTDFFTINESKKLTLLSESEAKEFVQHLFVTTKKHSLITLTDGKIVLYHIMEQKLLVKTNKELKNSMEKLKNGIFGEALIKSLEKRYPTEIFIQGL